MQQWRGWILKTSQVNHEAAVSLIRNYGDDSRRKWSSMPPIIFMSQFLPNLPIFLSHQWFQTSLGRAPGRVVLKSISLQNWFCQLFGGSADDAAFVLKLNPANGDIFVGGATASANFPEITGLCSATRGLCDGFVTILSMALRKMCFWDSALMPSTGSNSTRRASLTLWVPTGSWR